MSYICYVISHSHHQTQVSLLLIRIGNKVYVKRCHSNTIAPIKLTPTDQYVPNTILVLFALLVSSTSFLRSFQTIFLLFYTNAICFEYQHKIPNCSHYAPGKVTPITTSEQNALHILSQNTNPSHPSLHGRTFKAHHRSCKQFFNIPIKQSKGKDEYLHHISNALPAVACVFDFIATCGRGHRKHAIHSCSVETTSPWRHFARTHRRGQSCEQDHGYFLRYCGRNRCSKVSTCTFATNVSVQWTRPCHSKISSSFLQKVFRSRSD